MAAILQGKHVRSFFPKGDILYIKKPNSFFYKMIVSLNVNHLFSIWFISI